MTDPIRILLVDDHAVIRDGISAMLAPHDDLCVVGEAADGATAVRLAAQLLPDVVLMDLRMPDEDGARATAQITALSPPPRVLVLTMYDSDADIIRAIAAGAIGYLLKDTPRRELLDAIRAAAAGNSVLTPSVATKLVRQQHSSRPELSTRECQVLVLVAEGATNKDIAEALGVSQATVKTYLTRIFTKLDVADRTAAVTAALAQQLISLDRCRPDG
ncbi:DNA-binding NarL/FixJ family response regulator [Kibdelosporangium banguiense]|uniref:DNA-binding NarL/FixJ family response regulator n=1 Tax=Kibdelosporangium banguiense TaxID=1365924 RepID=A0ABS4U2W0_9PSEU|nr:response regulator transcription factor [Kibdelosporangium banguiense]MBP2330530.1 DNA-binding NarL/FixJ family response regulator [Kibdelosporangium banguiense]